MTYSATLYSSNFENNMWSLVRSDKRIHLARTHNCGLKTAEIFSILNRITLLRQDSVTVPKIIL